jgi:hypothetical protein
MVHFTTLEQKKRLTYCRTGLKLEPELRIWTRKTLVPRPDRIVPVK